MTTAPKDCSEDRALLLALLRRRSVRYGEFTLASGAKTNVYVDCRLTTLAAEAIGPLGRVFLDKIAARGWRPDTVGGLTLGADPIVSAVARESVDRGRPIDGFLVRKEPKGHGRQQYVEGVAEAAGRSAVIVEDVCTSGGSALLAAERARDFGFEVIGVVCLVDRESGGAAAIEAAGLAFERVYTMDEVTAEPA